MSFIQIQNKFQVSRNHFFGFLQVRHFVKSYLKLPNDKPMLSPIESFLLNLNVNAFNDKKCLSLFYGKLITLTLLILTERGTYGKGIGG